MAEMKTRCPICEGETANSVYWTPMRRDLRELIAVPAIECSTCGHVAPDPVAALAMADDLPQSLVDRCLAAAPIASDVRRPIRALFTDQEAPTRRTARRLPERDELVAVAH